MCAILVLIASSFSATAQDADSTRLSEPAFLAIVSAYHPVARAAALRATQARAGIQQARGLTDPLINGYTNQKTLDGKTYFSYQGLELEVPAWYGFSLKAGTEQASGIYTNPELTNGVLGYAGASLAINQLLFDKRRAAVRQAQAYYRQSLAEQRLTINGLYYEARSAYWSWVSSYQVLQLLDRAVAINETRRRYVNLEAQQGARSFIDTTEALAQLQGFTLQREAARLSYTRAGLELSTFLWVATGEPYQWATRTILPDSLPAGPRRQLDSAGYTALLTELRNDHPKLNSLGAKRDALFIDRRLKAQAFLPQLYAGASLLQKGAAVPTDFSSQQLRNNNKLSLDLSVPLFFRSARAAYRMAGLKVEEINLDIDQTTLELQAKLAAAFAEYENVLAQLAIARALQGNYERLYRGELMRFDAGESTLFLINSRESKMLEGAIKLAELNARLGKAYAAVFAAAGLWQ